MHIYFLRHGDASSSSRYSDSDRPLTDLGVRQATVVANFLQRMNVAVNIMLTSPLKRAQDTASIALPNIDKRQIIITELLVNGSDPELLFNELNERKASAALLVGHEPYLSEAISLLVGGNLNMEIEMRKCTLALIDISIPVHQGTGLLKFLIPVEAMA
jgi:phosphohistidine phosphatase